MKIIAPVTRDLVVHKHLYQMTWNIIKAAMLVPVSQGNVDSIAWNSLIIVRFWVRLEWRDRVLQLQIQVTPTSSSLQLHSQNSNKPKPILLMVLTSMQVWNQNYSKQSIPPAKNCPNFFLGLITQQVFSFGRPQQYLKVD